MKSGVLCLYFDATGSIFLQPPDSPKRVFYYCVVTPGGDSVPVAVLEFITCGHDVYSIEKNLELFVSALKKMTTSRPLVSQVEVDFSKAMLQATCKAFNNMDLSFYLQYTWERVHGSNKYEYPITIIHICSSHFIKAGIKRTKQFSNYEDLRNIMRCAVTLLIHKINLKDARMVFRAICKLFLTKKKSQSHDVLLAEYFNSESADFLTSADMEINVDEDIGIEEENDENECSDYSKLKREQSPFYWFFFNIYKEILSDSDNENGDENEFYCPRFIEYLLDELAAYYPLWSGIIIQEFGIRRNSNATVENWNKIIKQYVFDGRMRQLIPRAISTLANNIHGRLIHRKYGTKTTRQINNRKKKEKVSSTNDDLRIPKISINMKRSKSASDPLKSQKKKVHVQENDTEIDFDMNQETWCRKSTSKPYNAGFSAFPKSADMWQQQKKALDDQQLVCIQQQPDDSIENGIKSPINEIPLPWGEATDYQQNWETLSFHAFGNLINAQTLQTLLPNAELDDNVINIFLAITKDDTGDIEPLIFDAHFFSALLDESPRFGFGVWAQKVRAWSHKIWLMPKCEANHWTLVVIVFPSNKIIYLDSLHGTLSSHVLSKLCGFIEKLFRKKGLPPLFWKNWILHCPLDIPNQISPSGIGLNCGVHICVWGYIVCTSKLLYFSEDDMPKIRKWISQKLIAFAGQTFATETNNFGINKSDCLKSESKDSKLIKLSRQPPSQGSTTFEYCACLRYLF
ncbi:Ubiquitin-like-specific protease ESD4 [Cyphomyrmex costatus]|uniref:Ubiquitin-like-specific protease ESD4 n=1 Tax=Cyphomyrmex costatus TaxID=456900 RepID=A0A151IMD6_9HYME|nr:Ubiquitin-like-specific protease ESD4 [Cyphomyrmex costatus]